MKSNFMNSPPLSEHRVHTIICYGPETVYGDSTTYVIGTAEDKKKIDIKIRDFGIKRRGFGIKSRYQVEIGKKLGGQK